MVGLWPRGAGLGFGGVLVVIGMAFFCVRTVSKGRLGCRMGLMSGYEKTAPELRFVWRGLKNCLIVVVVVVVVAN